MIFDIINDIVHYKSKNLLEIPDNEKEYSGFMVNRWLSMYSDNYSIIINETTNKYYSNFKIKKDHYEFLCNIIPKGKIQRIQYLKKDKAETKIDKKVVEFLSKNLQISQREILQYIEDNNIDIKELSLKLKQYEQKG